MLMLRQVTSRQVIIVSTRNISLVYLKYLLIQNYYYTYFESNEIQLVNHSFTQQYFHYTN
jgi:hypothetical protein